MEEKRRNKICITLGSIALLNFTLFVIVAVNIGGDAVNGKVEHGKYYVMTGGSYTEVSRAVFTYSRIHVYSVWITSTLAIVTGFILIKDVKKNKLGDH